MPDTGKPENHRSQSSSSFPMPLPINANNRAPTTQSSAPGLLHFSREITRKYSVISRGKRCQLAL